MILAMFQSCQHYLSGQFFLRWPVWPHLWHILPEEEDIPPPLEMRPRFLLSLDSDGPFVDDFAAALPCLIRSSTLRGSYSSSSSSFEDGSECEDELVVSGTFLVVYNYKYEI
jgi:hypothetical protein